MTLTEVLAELVQRAPWGDEEAKREALEVLRDGMGEICDRLEFLEEAASRSEDKTPGDEDQDPGDTPAAGVDAIPETVNNGGEHTNPTGHKPTRARKKDQ